MVIKSIKIFSVFLILILQSCTIYYIEVNKSICIHGESNTATQTGSDLKENDIKASPVNDTKLKVPIPIP